MRKRLPYALTGKWWATIAGPTLIPTVIAVAMLYGRVGIIGGAIVAVIYTLWLGWLTLPGRYDRAVLERVLAALPTHLGLSEEADVRCAIYVPDGRGRSARQCDGLYA